MIKNPPLVDDKNVGLVIHMYINNYNLAKITGPFCQDSRQKLGIRRHIYVFNGGSIRKCIHTRTCSSRLLTVMYKQS